MPADEGSKHACRVIHSPSSDLRKQCRSIAVSDPVSVDEEERKEKRKKKSLYPVMIDIITYNNNRGIIQRHGAATFESIGRESPCITNPRSERKKNLDNRDIFIFFFFFFSSPSTRVSAIGCCAPLRGPAPCSACPSLNGGNSLCSNSVARFEETIWGKIVAKYCCAYGEIFASNGRSIDNKSWMEMRSV